MQSTKYIIFSLIRYFSTSDKTKFSLEINSKLRLHEEVYEVHFMLRNPLERVRWTLRKAD